MKKDNMEVCNVSIGDEITFGSYPQEKDGSEKPIEWIVLDKKDGNLLLLSKYALDCVEYNTVRANVTWETCDLRKWLNKEFYDRAFDSAEKAAILTARVLPHANPEYDTDPGNATDDKVFLLSIEEAEKYFANDEARKCLPTEYNIACGVYESGEYTYNGKPTCWWWLRTPGASPDRTAGINYGGFGYYDGTYVYIINNGVRPAMWVRGAGAPRS